MGNELLYLYPPSSAPVELEGVYLQENFVCGRQAGSENADTPYIYANFLTSLDGRIAVRAEGEPHYSLPQGLTSETDFRLFLELYAHADCIVTHSGYLRALAAGRLDNVLQIPQFEWTEYIHEWRAARGMKAAPDVVIVSGGLDFPLHDSLTAHGQQVHIVTGVEATDDRKRTLIADGREVHALGGQRHVNSVELKDFLSRLHYQQVYLVAGPLLLEDMLARQQLDRLYVTVRHQLFGGEDFQTLIPSLNLGSTGHLSLRQLYMEQEENDEPGQWYASFDCSRTMKE